MLAGTTVIVDQDRTTYVGDEHIIVELAFNNL